MCRVAEVDSTAVNFLFDTVRNHRELVLEDESTGQKTASPIRILFANPSKQVVREFELADLINYVQCDPAHLPLLGTSVQADSIHKLAMHAQHE